MTDTKKQDSKPAEKSKLDQVIDGMNKWFEKEQYDVTTWELKHIPGTRALADFEAKHGDLQSDGTKKALHDFDANQNSVHTPQVKTQKAPAKHTK